MVHWTTRTIGRVSVVSNLFLQASSDDCTPRSRSRADGPRYNGTTAPTATVTKHVASDLWAQNGFGLKTKYWHFQYVQHLQSVRVLRVGMKQSQMERVFRCGNLSRSWANGLELCKVNILAHLWVMENHCVSKGKRRLAKKTTPQQWEQRQPSLSLSSTFGVHLHIRHTARDGFSPESWMRSRTSSTTRVDSQRPKHSEFWTSTNVVTMLQFHSFSSLPTSRNLPNYLAPLEECPWQCPWQCKRFGSQWAIVYLLANRHWDGDVEPCQISVHIFPYNTIGCLGCTPRNHPKQHSNGSYNHYYFLEHENTNFIADMIIDWKKL